jgi:hypothetical protein
MITLHEHSLINQIIDRYVSLLYAHGRLRDESEERFCRIVTMLELRTTHEEIVPLRFNDMLKGDDGDLLHDLCGLHQHFEYGGKHGSPKLNDCFLPRYANV